MNLYKTQIKRELWENKVSFIYTPLVISLLILVFVACAAFYANSHFDNKGASFSFSTHHDSASFGIHVPESEPIDINETGIGKKEKKSFSSIALIKAEPSAFNAMVMGVMYSNCVMLYLVFSIVLSAYALRCLFDDRKNKDILFWRSMPVSETTVVLTKLIMIFLIAPLVILVLNIFVTLVAIVVGLIYFSLNGIEPSYLISSVFSGGAYYIPLQIFYELIFGLLMLFPLIGFAIFSSAYAKKTPFYIFAIPFLLVIADKILNSVFGISFGLPKILELYAEAIELTKDAFLLQHPLHFTQSMVLPLLSCIAIGAVLVAGSIWLRNNRYEI